MNADDLSFLAVLHNVSSKYTKYSFGPIVCPAKKSFAVIDPFFNFEPPQNYWNDDVGDLSFLAVPHNVSSKYTKYSCGCVTCLVTKFLADNHPIFLCEPPLRFFRMGIHFLISSLRRVLLVRK